MSHIPRFIKTRRGVIALAAVGAALLVEAGVVLAGASPLGQHRAVAVRLPSGTAPRRSTWGRRSRTFARRCRCAT